MFIAGINLILDVILNLVFMRFWDVAGIALSTSVVYICSSLFLMICSLKVLRESQGGVTPGVLQRTHFKLE
jgi:putative peptidoglycan lipid II flippase